MFSISISFLLAIIFVTSDCANMAKIATFEDVKNLVTGAYLIDVREANEIQETGKMPNSINIPLSQVEEALTQMTPDQFLKKYGKSQPKPNDQVIFTCKSGARALKAADALLAKGFKNIQYYKGSWTEWAQKLVQ